MSKDHMLHFNNCYKEGVREKGKKEGREGGEGGREGEGGEKGERRGDSKGGRERGRRREGRKERGKRDKGESEGGRLTMTIRCNWIILITSLFMNIQYT